VEELANARREIAAVGCDFALLSSVANVSYVTGTEVPIPYGAGAELTYGPWLALISAKYDAGWFIVPQGGAAAARKSGTKLDILPFEMLLDSFKPSDAQSSYLSNIHEALTRAGIVGSSARIGIEGRSLPIEAVSLLATTCPQAQMNEIEPALIRARLIKTEREIALLRATAHLADVSQHTLAELCQDAGKTEYEMFGTISARIFDAAGRDIPLSGELVTGPRTTTVEYPNGPRTRTTEAGDAALMDLSGRFNGYWFDCTNTYLIGPAEPSAHQLRYARGAQAACDAAMAALRPGAKACDAFFAAEAAFKTFDLPMAHYAGHQIGVTVNELPRLVPYDQTPIQAGMVFSVEPGAYEGPGGTFGARAEKMVLVTENGPEILSTFAWGI
jgi:Xaa-Pro dipeptidase